MSWWNATTVLDYGGWGGGRTICDFSADYPRQNPRIQIILLAGKYFFNLVPSRLFHSF